MGGRHRNTGNHGTEIAELGLQFARLRRRATLQRREIDAGTPAWQRWSSTMDEIAGLIDRIVACPASGTGDLTIKFGAILWLMEANESLLDLGDLRRLKRFRRDLGTIARNSGGRA